ncbi:hypothetical protein [Motiliproteus sp. MSK22-1]|uniref:hypothetical protein n=1 Tax=Motiliproteus sp. MSK22-1 TaxID=1897630 RepID=UPI000975EE91|nr:hypothetical protein [Motiliproteus sp. MSK22-1]OMH28037.1 hypothetical protein BGP75_21955 [Motiliproteus sp. MSK22-1]
MKFVIGIIFGILIAVQTPAAWDAYNRAKQCDSSMAKQLSSSFAKAHPDLDVVDCSFAHFYSETIKGQLGIQ